MTPTEFENRMKQALKAANPRAATLTVILDCLNENGFGAGVSLYAAWSKTHG